MQKYEYNSGHMLGSDTRHKYGIILGRITQLWFRFWYMMRLWVQNVLWNMTACKCFIIRHLILTERRPGSDSESMFNLFLTNQKQSVFNYQTRWMFLLPIDSHDKSKWSICWIISPNNQITLLYLSPRSSSYYKIWNLKQLKIQT